jgi:hypothetical protein
VESGISRHVPPISVSSDLSASGQDAATETFSWIPSALVSTMYTDDRDLLSTLYKVLYTVLIPLSITDDVLRTRRLLLFASQLHDERARSAFRSFPNRQAQEATYGLAYLNAAEKYNGGEVESGKHEAEQRLDHVCGFIAALLGTNEGSTQRKADLKKWAEGNDRRGFKLLRDLIDPDKDFKTLRKTQVIIYCVCLIVERVITAY